MACADNPAGPYDFLGYVQDAAGGVLGQRQDDMWPFDPAVLVDDDGRIHLYAGQGPLNEKMAKQRAKTHKFTNHMELEPDMMTLKTQPEPLLPNVTNSAGTGFETHEFFEASSIRKFDGKYYFMNTVLSNYIIQNSADIYRIRTLYLRESDTHDKLFGRIKYDDNSVTREFLIMDLSLDVGDTLNTDDWAELNVHPNQLNPVITIDSIYYKDGRKHLRTDFIGKGKHWSTWPPVIYDTLTFIEGVGPDMGLPYFLY